MGIENSQQVLIIKYGEIALRGKNRHIYENMLLEAIRKNLNMVTSGFTLYKEQGRLVVRWEEATDLSVIIPHVTCIFGITHVCTALRLDDNSLENIKNAAISYMQEHCKMPCTFRVTTKRADKRYPITSDQLSGIIGEHALNNIGGLKVNLSNPDYTLKIEIRSHAYIYSDKSENAGPGGLPPGSAGSAVLLLSGGIDSPVAGYLAAKRGIGITAVYFHSPPYTSERAKEKVIDLAKQLALHTGKIRLLAVNFTDIQLKLVDRTPPEKITILLKRTMLRMAEKIAQRDKALAIITGDSVGQVASQTLASLHAMTGAAEFPILRPLACFDKQEIVTIAQKIGTFDISIRPYDDCCTLFLPKHPETKPKLSIIQSIENNVDNLDELMEQAIVNAQEIQI